MNNIEYPFFVYIIESPSAQNLYEGVYEGDAICQAVKLNGLDCQQAIIASKNIFNRAMTADLYELIRFYDYKKLPIIHISCHGNEHGIAFTNGDSATWDDIRELLAPFNQAIQNNLLLCMSSCNGLYAYQQCMQDKQENLSFGALIGSSEKISWPDAAIGFATFYHQIKKGKGIDESVNAMRLASGNDDFACFKSTEIQKYYLNKRLEQLTNNVNELQESLDQLQG